MCFSVNMPLDSLDGEVVKVLPLLYTLLDFSFVSPESV